MEKLPPTQRAEYMVAWTKAITRPRHNINTREAQEHAKDPSVWSHARHVAHLDSHSPSEQYLAMQRAEKAEAEARDLMEHAASTAALASVRGLGEVNLLSVCSFACTHVWGCDCLVSKHRYARER